jgi:hypothetical protein
MPLPLWSLAALALCAPEKALPEFEQVVWVRNKAPQISLLYVVVPEAAKKREDVDKLVMRYAPTALREAALITADNGKGRPRFSGTFNVVFVVRDKKGSKHATATGYSVEQLRECTTFPREKALRTLGTHSWMFQKLPLIHHGP